MIRRIWQHGKISTDTVNKSNNTDNNKAQSVNVVMPELIETLSNVKNF